MNFESVDVPESAAIIQFSRVTGNRILFGSPFNHQGYIRLRINKAKAYRSLYETHISSEWGKNYIEVDLSFSQFAEAITSMNIGEGVPCTVSYFNGQKYPEPEVQKDERLTFNKELTDKTNNLVNSVCELIEIIENEKLTVKVRNRLIGQCNRLITELKHNLPFLAQQYAEHLDKLEQRAKTEVAAYCDLAVRQVGLDTLKLPMLPENTDV